MILASVVLSLYTRVTDDDRQHIVTVAELCNAIATFDQLMTTGLVITLVRRTVSAEFLRRRCWCVVADFKSGVLPIANNQCM